MEKLSCRIMTHPDKKTINLSEVAHIYVTFREYNLEDVFNLGAIVFCVDPYRQTITETTTGSIIKDNGMKISDQIKLLIDKFDSGELLEVINKFRYGYMEPYINTLL